jgi:hypothetical protein
VLGNTIVAFTTDYGAEAIDYPDGGITPFANLIRDRSDLWQAPP